MPVEKQEKEVTYRDIQSINCNEKTGSKLNWRCTLVDEEGSEFDIKANRLNIDGSEITRSIFFARAADPKIVVGTSGATCDLEEDNDGKMRRLSCY